MSDNKRKLYNALSQDYDLGSYEKFVNDIADEGKRKKLYEATKEEYDYGDYDKFSSQLGYPNSASPQVATTPTNKSETPTTSVASTVQEASPSAEATTQPTNVVEAAKVSNATNTQPTKVYKPVDYPWDDEQPTNDGVFYRASPQVQAQVQSQQSQQTQSKVAPPPQGTTPVAQAPTTGEKSSEGETQNDEFEKSLEQLRSQFGESSSDGSWEYHKSWDEIRRGAYVKKVDEMLQSIFDSDMPIDDADLVSLVSMRNGENSSQSIAAFNKYATPEQKERFQALEKWREQDALTEKKINAVIDQNPKLFLLLKPKGWDIDAVKRYIADQFVYGEYNNELLWYAGEGSEIPNQEQLAKYIISQELEIASRYGKAAHKAFMDNSFDSEATQQLFNAALWAEKNWGYATKVNFPEPFRRMYETYVGDAAERGELGTEEFEARVNDAFAKLNTYMGIMEAMSAEEREKYLPENWVEEIFTPYSAYRPSEIKAVEYVTNRDLLSHLDESLREANGVYNDYVSDFVNQKTGDRSFGERLIDAATSSAGAVSPTDIQASIKGANSAYGQVPLQQLVVNVDELDHRGQNAYYAKKMLEEVEELRNNGNPSSVIEGLYNGFKAGFFNESTWDFGGDDLARARAIKRTVEKVDRGEELTREEDMLMEALAMSMAARMLLDTSISYDVGNGVGISIPYLIEMAFPIKGGRAVARGFYKWAIKRYGKGVLRSIPGKMVGGAVHLLGTGVDAAARTALVGTSKVAAGATERMTKDYELGEGENGEPTVEITGPGLGAGQAIGEAFYDQAKTYWVEGAGGELISRIFNPVARGTKALGKKMGIDFGSANTAWSTFVKRTGWHGTPVEYAEEVLDQILSTPVTELTLDSNEQTGIFTVKNQVTTALTCMVLGSVLNAPNAVAYKSESKRTELMRENWSKQGEVLFGNNWGDIRAKIDGATMNDLSTIVTEIIADPKYSANQKKVVLRYAGAMAQDQALLSAEEQREMDYQGERVIDAQGWVDEGYNEGYDATSAESRRAVAEQDQDARKAVIDLLGLPEDAKVAEVIQQRYDSKNLRTISTKIIDDSDLNREQKDIMLDYVASQKRIQGMQKRHADEVEMAVDYFGAVVDGNSNKQTSQLVIGTLKDGEREVYIVDGEVMLLEDGTIDVANSTESLFVRDVDTGETESISAGELMGIEVQDPAEVKAQIAEDIKTRMQQEYDASFDTESTGGVGAQAPVGTGFESSPMEGEDNADDGKGEAIDETADAAETPMYRQGDEVRVVDSAGNELTGVVLEEENVDGEVLIEVGGRVLPIRRDALDAMNSQPEAGSSAEVDSQEGDGDTEAETESQEIDDIEEGETLGDVFKTFTTKKGEVVEQRTKTKVRGGIRYTTIHSTRNGNEVTVGNSYFPMPDGLEAIYIPEGVEVLGVKELREDVNSGAKSGTIVVRLEDGGLETMESPLIMKQQEEGEEATDETDNIGGVDAEYSQNEEDETSDGESVLDGETGEDSQEDDDNSQQEGDSEGAKDTGTEDILGGEGDVEGNLSEDEASIPVDEKGEPMYESAPVEATIADIYNDPDLDEEEADAFVQAKIDGATKRIADLEGRKPQMGESKVAFKEEKAKWREQLEAEQASLAYWQGVQEARAKESTTSPLQGTPSISQSETRGELDTNGEMGEIGEMSAEAEGDDVSERDSKVDKDTNVTEEGSVTEGTVEEETPIVEEQTQEETGELTTSPLQDSAQSQASGGLSEDLTEIVGETDQLLAERKRVMEAWIQAEEGADKDAKWGDYSQAIDALESYAMGLSDEQLAALQTHYGKGEVREIDDEISRRDEIKVKNAQYDELLSKQYPIERKGRKGTGKLEDALSKDVTRPVMTGVYHDEDGYAVATDAKVLVADKREYNGRKKGKIIGKDGKEIPGNYPKWKLAIPVETEALPIDLQDLSGFIGGVKAKLKENGIKPKDYGKAVVMIKTGSGTIVYYPVDALETWLNGAMRLGATGSDVGVSERNGFIVAKTKNGVAMLASKGGLAYNDTGIVYEVNPSPSTPQSRSDSSPNGRGALEKQVGGGVMENATEAQRLATEAVITSLEASGIEVVEASDAMAEAVMGMGGVEMSAKKKRALETASVQEEHQPTVVSSADGAKVLNNLDNVATEYEEKSNQSKTFLGDVAKALGAERKGSGSQYVTFETKNGKVVTIRLSNHNATVSNFDNNGEADGISIVVSAKGNNGMTNDGDAHVVEHYYDAIKLRRAEGKPLADIVRSIKQALYSGEFTDTTGLAERQEVNLNEIEPQIVYHGSGAKFDAFDHSHMSEGEGAQAYGWGTYVTEVEGIGKQYANTMRDKAITDKHRENAIINNLARQVLVSNNGNKAETLDYLRGLLNESWSDKKRVRAQIKIIETGKFLPETKVKAQLYTVEIPEDNGSNYLYHDKVTANNVIADVKRRLYDILSQGQYKGAERELREELDEVFVSGLEGDVLYNNVSAYLGGDKQASQLFNEMGFVGIKYPAQYTTGGRADGASNYVIFNEADAKITSRVEFLKTPQGVVYGWTDGKKVYLTKEGMNPETPIHEYTHLWARAMMQGNAEGWQSVKDLLRGTPIWNEVMSDANYADIHGDEDAVASECLARLSGKENAKRMEAEARKMIDEAKGVFAKADAVTLVERMKKALQEFWNWVGKNLFDIKSFGSIEEVTDRVLYDLIHNSQFIIHNSELPGIDKQIIGERGASALDKADEATHRMDNLGVAREMEDDGLLFRDGDVTTSPLGSGGELGTTAEASTVGYSDAEVSMANDPIAKVMGKSQRSKKQQAKFAERVRKAMRNRVAELAEKMHLDNVEVVESSQSTPSPQGGTPPKQGSGGELNASNGGVMSARKARAKGWFDMKTGRIVINISNHLSVADVERTLLHEAVAHYGLRQLFGKQFDTFLDNVYRSAEADIRAQIVELAKKHGWDFRTATEEYLAGLAEDTNFEALEHNWSWWQQIKQFFMDMLESIGWRYQGPELSDNELRYLLWRSYENMVNPGRHRSILGKAEDVAKQYALGVGNYSADAETMSQVAEPKLTIGGIDLGKIKATSNGRKVIATTRSGHNQIFKSVHKYAIEKFGAENVEYEKAKSGSIYMTVDLPNGHYVEIRFASHTPSGYSAGEIETKAETKGIGWSAINGSVGAKVDISFNTMTSDDLQAFLDLMNEYAENGFPQEVVDELQSYRAKPNEVSEALGISVDTLAEGGELYSDGDGIEAVNERFNTELQQQIDGTLPKGHIYQLGMPSEVLLATGIAKAPIQLNSQRLMEKSSNFGHDYELSELKDLVKAINNPIAIFAYGDKNKAQNIVVEIQHEGKNFIIGLSIRPTVGGQVLDINSIRNVFPKDNAEWLNWITQGKALYIDKERVQDLINQQRTNLADVEYLDLNSIANIIQNFENPIISREENNESNGSNGLSNGSNGLSNGLSNGERDSDEGVLFRDGDVTVDDLGERDRVIARDAYERMMSQGRYQFTEAMQDSMMGLKLLYKAILGKKMRVEDIPDFENAYVAENLMSSQNAAEQHVYFVKFVKPLLDAVYKLAGSNAESRQQLTDYMMAKHGLERNQVMAGRDAKRVADEAVKDIVEEDKKNVKWQEVYNEALKENRRRDYSGLTTLTGKENVAEAEYEAQKMVEEYEKAHGEDQITELWERVNAATKNTLEKLYRSGLMGKEQYEQTDAMYQYYIPLRGWEQTTSDEVYGYLTSKNGPMGSPIKHAKGRTSKADDPIATIGLMADDAIRHGNRNNMKQRFLNFVLNHPSDAVSVSELWLEYNEALDEWVPVFPNIDKDDSAEEIERKTQEFEARMEALANENPDKYKRGKDAANIPYKVVPGNEREHQVLVKRGGRTFVLTINGNPRAAQALNGLTNPDVKADSVVGPMLDWLQAGTRQLSALYTTRNPDFVVSNFLRDMIYSNSMVWIKESPKYAAKFHKNCVVAGTMLPILLTKWERGTLDMRKELEHNFFLFMINGGETGYTEIRDLEKHKRTVVAELKKKGNIGRKAWRALGIVADDANRSIENTARFAAFLTSRSEGRSVQRSAYDAKEISVNFNKKGAGGKFVKANGQTFLGKAGGYMSGYGRLFYAFWNAGMQGMTNFGKAAKRHPFKATFAMALMYALGAWIASLNDDDDDDKDKYYLLPEYVRRSNICFRFGDGWVTIPLPIEFRAMYGLGELFTAVASGNEKYTNEELAMAIAGQFSQLLPLDMLEGGGGLNAFTPTIIKPVVEAYRNVGWHGNPIHREFYGDAEKYDPQWTLAYSSTSTFLMDLTKALNEVGGGDNELPTRGNWWTDWNPARMEYMLKGYGGGVYSIVDKLIKSGETVFGDRPYEAKNTPMVNRIYKEDDPEAKQRKINGIFYKALEEAKETEDDVNKMEKKAESDSKYKAKLEAFKKSDEYKKYVFVIGYKDAIDEINKRLKYKDIDVPAEELDAQILMLKQELAEGIWSFETQTTSAIERQNELRELQIQEKYIDLDKKQQAAKDSIKIEEKKASGASAKEIHKTKSRAKGNLKRKDTDLKKAKKAFEGKYGEE